MKDTDEEAVVRLLQEATPLINQDKAPVEPQLLLRYIALMSRFDMEAARSTYVDAARKGGLDDATTLLWVRTLIAKGKQEEARDILNSLKVGPFEAERNMLLGMSWMDSGNMDQASHYLQESIRWDHQSDGPYHLLEQIEPRANWGLVHQIERFDYIDQEASRELFLEDATGRGPSFRLAKALYAWHNESQDAALSAWKSLRSRNGDNLLVVKVGARMAFHMGKFELGRERYEEALRLDPGNVGLMQEFADALLEMGDPSHSLTILDDILAISPGNRKALMTKIRAFSHQGNRELCSETVKEFVRLPHWDSESQPQVVEMLIACGAHQEAQRLLEGLIRASPRDLRLLRLSIKNQTLAGKLDEAVKIADLVMRISDEGFEDHMVKARIQFQKRDHKGSKRTLGNILRLQPDYLPALSLLKDVNKEEGDEVAVMELCDQILHLDPDDVSAMKDKAASLSRTGAHVEAMEMYSRVLEAPGSNPQMLGEILTAMISDSRFQEASAISDSFLPMHGEDWELWALRGNALFGVGRMEEAAEAYGKATSVQGNDSQLWYSRGLALEQAGQLQDALDCYDKAIVRNLGNSEAWMGKAIVLERMGDLRESLRNLDQALKVDPGHRSALIMKARLLVRMTKYQEAIYFLDLAVKLDRRDPVPLILRKEVMKHMQDHNGVVLTCDEILRFNEDDHDALLDKAKALQSLQQHGDALKVLARLQRSNPEDLGIMGLRKSSLVSLGKASEAMSVLEEMLSRRPDDKSLLLDLLDMRTQMEDTEGSLQVLERVLALDPSHTAANHAMAEILVRTERFNEACEFLQSMLAREVWDAHSQDLLAQAQLGIGEAAEALSTADEGLAMEPSLEGLHVSKAQALLALGRLPEALEATEVGLRFSPQNYLLWRSRANAFMRSDDTESALNAYDRAVGFGDSDAETFFQRALAQRSLGKIESAVESLKKALGLQPSHAQAWSLLGALQTELGNYRDAKKSLEAASVYSPDDRQTLLRRARLHAIAKEAKKAIEVYDEMTAKGMADAPLLVEKGELLLSEGDWQGAKSSFREALSLDPFLPGLEDKVHEIESSLHKQELMDTARHILERNQRDGQELNLEYIRSMAGEGQQEELEDLLLSPPEDKRPVIWSPEFEALESSARQVLLSGDEREVAQMAALPLAKVYARMPEKDILHAKEIMHHIHTSLTEDTQKCEIISTRVHSVREAISARGSAPSLYEVMKRFGLGPYASRLALEAWRGRSQ